MLVIALYATIIAWLCLGGVRSGKTQAGSGCLKFCIGFSLARELVIAPYITSIAVFTPIKGWFAGSYGLPKKFFGHV